MVYHIKNHASAMPSSCYTVLHADASIPPANPLMSSEDFYSESNPTVWFSARSYASAHQAARWVEDIESIAKPLRGDFDEMNGLAELSFKGNELAQQALEYSLKLFIERTADDESLIERFNDWSLDAMKEGTLHFMQLEQALSTIARHTDVYEFLEHLAVRDMWAGKLVLSVSPRWKRIAFPNRDTTFAEEKARRYDQYAAAVTEPALQRIKERVSAAHSIAEKLAKMIDPELFIHTMAKSPSAWILVVDTLMRSFERAAGEMDLPIWDLKDSIFHGVFRTPGLEDKVAEGFRSLAEVTKNDPRAFYYMTEFAAMGFHEAQEALREPFDHEDMQALVLHDEFDYKSLINLYQIGGWEESIFKVLDSLSHEELMKLLNECEPSDFYTFGAMLKRYDNFDLTKIQAIEDSLYPPMDPDIDELLKDGTNTAVIIPFNRSPDSD